MNNLTNSTPNRQMSLLEARFSNIRRVEHEGIEYFSLVDIMAELERLRPPGYIDTDAYYKAEDTE